MRGRYLRFCGYLAQVKAVSVEHVERVSGSVLGAAWGPQEARMQAAILLSAVLSARQQTARPLPFITGPRGSAIPSHVQAPSSARPKARRAVGRDSCMT
jgi:hypothetical protein